jgi:hypothetical protein
MLVDALRQLPTGIPNGSRESLALRIACADGADATFFCSGRTYGSTLWRRALRYQDG